jgi:membrane associated rhomboid family serine protease
VRAVLRFFFRDPATATLVLLCAAWTLVSKALDLTYSQAGAITQTQLWHGEYWRLPSATLLHHMESWVHLVVNAFSLFFVGRVIERACGRRVFLACVVGAAFAGFGVSLMSAGGNDVHMGISGGIAGLVGLVLAIEWCVTRSLLEFLRQRNTILIAVFLAISFPLALLVERRLPGVQVDHAAHGAGFLVGLLAGLAHYTRRGPRPLRGAVVGLALTILPVAYAGHPLLDARYHLWRGDRAHRAGDSAAAVAAYERALSLDPSNPRAGLRLAEWKDDPAILEGLRRPDEYRDAFLGVHLDLAARRLPADPAAARRLVEAAHKLGSRAPGPWLRFAEAAEALGFADEAYRAWLEAADLMPDSEAWRPHARALMLIGRRSEKTGVAEVLVVARGATAGLADAAARTWLESAIAAAAHSASNGALASPADPTVARDLAALFQTLAENTDDARRADYRVRSAYWLWREAEAQGAPLDEVRARFRAALSEARENGDSRSRETAEQWFRERGLPVPDLEGEEAGG